MALYTKKDIKSRENKLHWCDSVIICHKIVIKSPQSALSK